MKRDKVRRRKIIFEKITIEHFVGCLAHLQVTNRSRTIVTLVAVGVFKVQGRRKRAALVKHLSDGLIQVVSIDRLSRI